jgi:hypothetical protein
MATYSLNSINSKAFDEFIVKPSAPQLECIAAKFAQAELHETPPWADDPQEWIRRHLSEPDWYKDLTEDRMQAWDNGIRELLHQPEFDLKAHGFHCAVGDMFIQIAAKVYERRGADAVVCKFWPYRFFDDYGLDHMGYFPTHALLTNEQVGKLIEEVGDYDALLEELAAHKPDFVARWRDQIKDDIQEAMPALREIHQQKRMWYSQFDY